MAVYSQGYKPYPGAYTSRRWRFLTIPRFAYQGVFKSRIFLGFFVLSFVPPLTASLIIYLHYNVSALEILGIGGAKDLIAVDAGFFSSYNALQGMLCYLLALTIGPALVSPDLINNALPLYLSRPFSRSEYVLGKFTVIAGLASMISWVPLSGCFLLQAYLEGGSWLAAHWRIAAGIILGSVVWITVISLLALAVSAWVRWKPVARAVMVGLFLVVGGFGEAINGIFHTTWGGTINLGALIGQVWSALFGVTQPPGPPLGVAWFALLAYSLLSLLALRRKIKAYEIVR